MMPVLLQFAEQFGCQLEKFQHLVGTHGCMDYDCAIERPSLEMDSWPSESDSSLV